MAWLRELIERVPDIPGRQAMVRYGVPKGLRKIFLFWQVSASAWLIDVAGLTLLLWLGTPVYLAACLSILPAFLWSFVFSTYKIYFRKKGFSPRRFSYYVGYNGVMMLAMGWIVAQGIHAGYAPVLMKAAVAPATFFLNYFFTRTLLKEKKAAA